MHKIHNPNNQNGGGTPQNYSKTKINPNKRQTYTYSDSLQSMDKIQEQLKSLLILENII